MMITKITKGQQITLPAELRKRLNLKEGMTVEIEIRNEEVVIRPVKENIEDLFKKAYEIKPKKHLTAKQMDELIENGFLR